MADAILEVVPDYMSALVGYRAWNVTPEGDLLSLNQLTTDPWLGKIKKLAICSVQESEMWQMEQLLCGGRAQNAISYATTMAYVRMSPLLLSAILRAKFKALFLEARQEMAKEHHAPEKDCRCGIYAAKSDESHHFQSYAAGAAVWGEVFLWGKMQEYCEGYRAEFAYPKSLKTRDATLAEKIGRQYGVPCETVEPFAPEVEGLSVHQYTLGPSGILYQFCPTVALPVHVGGQRGWRRQWLSTLSTLCRWST